VKLHTPLSRDDASNAERGALAGTFFWVTQPVLAEAEPDAIWVAIEVAVEQVEAFEQVRDPGIGYREFALPAEFTNDLRAVRFGPASKAP